MTVLKTECIQRAPWSTLGPLRLPYLIIDKKGKTVDGYKKIVFFPLVRKDEKNYKKNQTS